MKLLMRIYAAPVWASLQPLEHRRCQHNVANADGIICPNDQGCLRVPAEPASAWAKIYGTWAGAAKKLWHVKGHATIWQGSSQNHQ